MLKSASAILAKQQPTRATAVDAARIDDQPSLLISPDTLAALDRFQQALDARGAPLTTLRYIAACKRLAAFQVASPLHEISGRDAQQCLSNLRSAGLAPRTLATTLSAWKTWFRVLAKTDARFRADAFDTVRIPKPPKRLPNALSESEMAKLLDPAKDSADESPLDVRDQAMFEVLYGCGIRVSELAGLDVADIDLSAGEIRVYGKGRKERILPLGEKAKVAVQSWLHARHALTTIRADERAVFIGARGGRIATTVIRKLLSQRAMNANVLSHVHPHRLRHSFASHVLQSSRDLRAVQELMGHASIASTQVYTHLDFQHLASVYDDTHPRASKRKK